MSFDTPVLLIAWRRPHTTKQVIDAIRAVQPTRMFVACDGPRPDRPGEPEKVIATRELIEREIDWPCTIERRYSVENQGCKMGVSRAISWFFENVEAGIIFEDDCLPDITFFRYCEELLDYYRYDYRVMHISGNNHGLNDFTTLLTYRFSRCTHIWGWATWRRAWQYYDVDMKVWPEVRSAHLLRDIYDSPDESHLRRRNWDLVYFNKLDTWDYQWYFACLVQSGLSIVPSRNLVSNIGFGIEATHTKHSSGKFANLPTFSLQLPILHPRVMMRDTSYDHSYFVKTTSIFQRGIFFSIKNILRLSWIKMIFWKK